MINQDLSAKRNQSHKHKRPIRWGEQNLPLVPGAAIVRSTQVGELGKQRTLIPTNYFEINETGSFENKIPSYESLIESSTQTSGEKY